MKNNFDLWVIGIVGAILAFSPLELKDRVVETLPLLSNIFAPTAYAVAIAMVSAYSSIKVARIRAEVDKTRQSVPYQESLLDTLVWGVLIFALVVEVRGILYIAK